MLKSLFYSPHSESSHGSSGEKHANMYRGGLYGGSDGDNDTHQLHEADSAETISDCCLRESS